MKTILILAISLFIGQTIVFAQEEMEVMEQQHKTEIFIEQNLMDFNAKYHTIFIAAYKNFKSILGEEEKKKDYSQYKTTVDFTSGKNETIILGEKSSVFTVNFDCQDDELIARAMYKDIIKRILTVSPKGLEQASEKVNGNDLTIIQYNPKEAEKSAYQPITEVLLDYENLSISVSVTTPAKH